MMEEGWFQVEGMAGAEAERRDSYLCTCVPLFGARLWLVLLAAEPGVASVVKCVAECSLGKREKGKEQNRGASSSWLLSCCWWEGGNRDLSVMAANR